jgi:hypothetical protein
MMDSAQSKLCTLCRHVILSRAAIEDIPHRSLESLEVCSESCVVCAGFLDGLPETSKNTVDRVQQIRCFRMQNPHSGLYDEYPHSSEDSEYDRFLCWSDETIPDDSPFPARFIKWVMLPHADILAETLRPSKHEAIWLIEGLILFDDRWSTIKRWLNTCELEHEKCRKMQRSKSTQFF